MAHVPDYVGNEFREKFVRVAGRTPENKPQQSQQIRPVKSDNINMKIT